MTYSPALRERFWAKVDKSGDCWVWTGAHSGDYGSIFLTKHGGIRNERAHRVSYELANGPIPAGLTIDHLCRNRGCVNPAHLEAVSRGENVRRGGVYRRRPVCLRGHATTEPGSRTARGNCIECQKEAAPRYAPRKRAYMRESSARRRAAA